MRCDVQCRSGRRARAPEYERKIEQRSKKRTYTSYYYMNRKDSVGLVLWLRAWVIPPPPPGRMLWREHLQLAVRVSGARVPGAGREDSPTIEQNEIEYEAVPFQRGHRALYDRTVCLEITAGLKLSDIVYLDVHIWNPVCCIRTVMRVTPATFLTKKLLRPTISY